MIAADDLEGRDVRVAENPDGKIVGIIAWRPVIDEPKEYFIDLLAVEKSHWRQGYGEALKIEAMALITTVGGRLVVSKVHRQNRRMLALNTKLGIPATSDPDDGELKICAAPIKPASVLSRLRRA